MNRLELINRLAERYPQLTQPTLLLAVKSITRQIGDALSQGERIEIRGFGSFSVHQAPARMGRNPATGETVQIPAKNRVHFKPGQELKSRVNKNGLEKSSE